MSEYWDKDSEDLDILEQDQDKENSKDMNDSLSTQNMVEYLRDNMELTLSCEIGALKLTLSELINYKIGTLLEFMTDLQSIKLKLNSVTIGYGQIVKIDGKYGIKINKMLSILDSIVNS